MNNGVSSNDELTTTAASGVGRLTQSVRRSSVNTRFHGVQSFVAKGNAGTDYMIVSVYNEYLTLVRVTQSGAKCCLMFGK